MSSVQQGSSGGQRSGNGSTVKKRSWTPMDEDLLIDSLRELIAQGQKSDNGFRTGYLNKLENAMRKEMLLTDLKANPHINSKITAWKRSYYALCGIMSRSGVGFNRNGNYMIEMEDDTWEQIVRVDPNACNMRFKPWPYFDSWQEIFGRDRATGDAAEDILEALNDIMGEASHQGDQDAGFDKGQEQEPLTDEADHSASHSHSFVASKDRMAKKRKVSGDIKEICVVLDRIGRNNDARLANLAVRIGYDFDLAKQKKEAFAKLEGMNFLTVDQHFEVCELLLKEVDKLEVFLALSDAMVPC